MLLGVCIAGVVLGLLGFVVSFARSGKPGKDEPAGGPPWSAMMTGLLITLVFWLLSLQTRAPFSSGQTLGYGFLIGGVLGSFATGSRGYMRAAPALSRLLAMSFLALLGASVTLLLFRAYPQHSLQGFAIGCVMTVLVAAAFGERLTSSTNGVSFAVVSVVLSAATVLAVYRFDSVTERQWWSLPVFIGMISILSSLVAAEIRTGALNRLTAASARWLSALISAALTIGITAIVAWRAAHDLRVFYAAAVGAVALGVAAWLLDRSDDDRLVGLEKSAIAAGLVVAFYMVEFKVMAGLGVGIGLIAAWSLVSQLLPREVPSDDAVSPAITSAGLVTLFGFGTTLLLLRLFIQQYRSEIGTRELEMHITLIGALVGALLPAVLAACAMRGGYGSVNLPRWVISAQGLAAGLAAALIPFAIYLLWEVRALTGLCFGLALGVGLLLGMTRAIEEIDARKVGLAVLFAAGGLLMACQFGDYLLNLEVTRSMKFWTLGVAAAALALWVVATGVLAARRAQ